MTTRQSPPWGPSVAAGFATMAVTRVFSSDSLTKRPPKLPEHPRFERVVPRAPAAGAHGAIGCPGQDRPRCRAPSFEGLRGLEPERQELVDRNDRRTHATGLKTA